MLIEIAKKTDIKCVRLFLGCKILGGRISISNTELVCYNESLLYILNNSYDLPLLLESFLVRLKLP